MSSPQNTPLNANRKDVRTPYTFAKLKHDLLAVHDKNNPEKSLRGLARKYGVSYGVIQRVIAGREPRVPAIREALGLPKKKYGQKRRNWQRCCKKVWGIIWGETTATSPPANTN